MSFVLRMGYSIIIYMSFVLRTGYSILKLKTKKEPIQPGWE
jgi:hypothetical protein